MLQRWLFVFTRCSSPTWLVERRFFGEDVIDLFERLAACLYEYQSLQTSFLLFYQGFSKKLVSSIYTYLWDEEEGEWDTEEYQDAEQEIELPSRCFDCIRCDKGNDLWFSASVPYQGRGEQPYECPQPL